MPPSKSIEKPDNRTRMILKQMTDPAQPRGRVQREKVEELEAGKPVGRIELVVLRRYPRRLVNSKSYTGPLAAACGRDETGLVGIVLWGDDVTKVRTGDIIRIEDGWCRRRDGELVVSTGRSGRLTVIDR